ncbi:sugar kinase [Conexibacter sp. JD483]|uniref:sugar kinase n=1 Tax=unclassified Conexibacter TaxID=2627773 RepID=UPI002721DDA4|nr:MULTISPECIES: sugar kinase [unclassified Conexibacter]MDO8189262.1 sugar kinase [Conexibacter sp. CPCC 205706]MDO8201269.1 sugar kinase [Conexibacter sp. CPCC 205762]MDR9372176.1 sugar kinase [Conexibacter sp. JD483]
MEGSAPASPEVVTCGETMGLLLADDGLPLRRARQFRRTLAGAELNTAVGLARLGHRVAYGGRVGDDPFGEDVRATLLAEGIDAAALHVDPDVPTGLLTRDRDGHRRIRVVYHRAGMAGSRLTADDLAALPIERARLLHLTGITPALSESAARATADAAARARAAGVPIAFDPNFRARLWSREQALPALRELAAGATIVLTSEDEGAWLAGIDAAAAPARDGDASGVRGAPARDADALAQEIAAWFHARGAAIVVVKRGADGAWVSDEGRGGAVPALAVAAVTDPVGAGDAFDAGFLSGWLDGLDAPAAARRGAACGAAVVQVAGDLEGLPTRTELEDLLSDTREADR